MGGFGGRRIPDFGFGAASRGLPGDVCAGFVSSSPPWVRLRRRGFQVVGDMSLMLAGLKPWIGNVRHALTNRGMLSRTTGSFGRRQPAPKTRRSDHLLCDLDHRSPTAEVRRSDVTT